MPKYSLTEAEQRLRDIGGFEWLLSGTQFWSAKDVSDHLKEMGIGGEKITVLRWFKTLPNVMDFGGLGLRASREDLIRFFAENISGIGETDASTGEAG